MYHLNKNLTILLTMLLLFSSCYNSEKGQGNIFHYNEPTGIASLDPAFAKNQSIMWAIHQLYNTLVEVDSALNIVPSLATHWDISDDRKTYTFYLRPDVFFQDDAAFSNGHGRRMVAADAVYSFQRLMNSKTASPGAWIFNGKVDSV